MLEHYIYFRSGVAASLDFVIGTIIRGWLCIMWIQLLVLSSMSLGLIHLHSSRKGVRIFWADIDQFGARWICSFCSHRCSRETLTMTLQSIWCIDMVGKSTINDLNLLLESVIVVPTMTLEYVQFCDLMILWDLCNFVISWFCDICAILWFRDSVTSGPIHRDDPLWSEHLHVLENCEFGMSWFLQPWPPSDLRACEFGWCSWGTTTWNPGFMLFETKLAGIDTFRCLEYRLQVLNKVGWFFIDNVKLLESVFGKQNSWPILFWPNEFELTILVEPK